MQFRFLTIATILFFAHSYITAADTTVLACSGTNHNCASVCKELGLSGGYMGCCFSEKSNSEGDEVMEKAQGSCFCCRMIAKQERDTCEAIRLNMVRNPRECRCRQVHIVNGQNEIQSEGSCGSEGGYGRQKYFIDFL